MGKRTSSRGKLTPKIQKDLALSNLLYHQLLHVWYKHVSPLKTVWLGNSSTQLNQKIRKLPGWLTVQHK